MLEWERRALQLGPCDEPRLLQTLGFTFDPDAEHSRTAWWPTVFFAPEIWRRWGVGLVIGSLNLWPLDDKTSVDLPGISATIPEQAVQLVGKDSDLVRRWSLVRITPVLVAGEALGFVIGALNQQTRPAKQLVEVFAPTHLRTRLGIPDKPKTKTPIEVGVLACDF